MFIIFIKDLLDYPFMSTLEEFITRDFYIERKNLPINFFRYLLQRGTVVATPSLASPYKWGFGKEGYKIQEKGEGYKIWHNDSPLGELQFFTDELCYEGCVPELVDKKGKEFPVILIYRLSARSPRKIEF